MWIPWAAAAYGQRGVRAYGSFVHFFHVSAAVDVDAEYRSGPVAVSVGGGAGGLFIPHIVSLGVGGRAELHVFLAQLPADFELEVAGGGGPMYGRNPLLLPFAEPDTSWSLFPSAFLGLRRESPTGLLYRVGAGLNTFSAGATLSIGYAGGRR